MPFSSTAFQRRLRDHSLFDPQHTDNCWTLFNLSYKTDEEKKDWFDKLPQSCQNWEYIKEHILDWTLRSESGHLRRHEFPRGQMLDDAAVKQRWAQAEEDWHAYTYGELSLIESYRDPMRAFRDQGGLKVWHFMVFGLPSLSSQSFGDIACRQYWFVISLIASVARWSEESCTKASHIRGGWEHKVTFDNTHILPVDMECFEKGLGMLTHHLAVPSNNFESPVSVEECTLKVMLKEFKTTFNFTRSVLIMLTPFNPVRQLIQHTMCTKDPRYWPGVIVCTRAQNSNVIPSIGAHSDMIRRLYSGDQTSDLVESFFRFGYHSYPLIADATLEKLPSGCTDEQKKEIKYIFGEIALYVRKDHVQSASGTTPPEKDPWKVDKEPDQEPQGA